MTQLKNYFYRSVKSPVNLAVYLVLPAIIIALNIMIMNNNMEGDLHIVNGNNLMASGIVIQILVMFQMFGTSLVYDLLYQDFRSDMRWRLLAAPKSLNSYLRANLISAFILNMVIGTVLVTVGHFAFSAYLFNIPMLIATMAVTSAFTMAVGTIIFLVTEKKSAAEGLAHAMVWPQFIPLMMGLANEGIMETIFTRATPAALAMNAIYFSASPIETRVAIPMIGSAITDVDMTRAFTDLGILAGVTVVVWIVAAIIGKTKKF